MTPPKKNVASWIAIIAFVLMSPLILVGLLIVGMVTLVIAPFEWLFYRRSAYFKKYHYPYRLGITRHDHFHFLNYLAKENSDIIHHNLGYGYAYLYSSDLVFIYVYHEGVQWNEALSKWEVFDDHDVYPLDEYLAEELTHVLPDVATHHPMLMVKEKMIAEADLLRAHANHDFIVYRSMDDLAFQLNQRARHEVLNAVDTEEETPS